MVLLDTAGLRETNDPLEQLGIERALSQAATADLHLVLLDGSVWTREQLECAICPDPFYADLFARFASIPTIVVWNKADLVAPHHFPPAWWHGAAVSISTETGEGLERLGRLIRTTLLGADTTFLGQEFVGVNERQASVLHRAHHELALLQEDVCAGIPYDLCAVRLELCAAILGEVIGFSSSTDVLNALFGRFCIGK